jgi:glycerol-3-phosphate acyltransferase PlsY
LSAVLGALWGACLGSVPFAWIIYRIVMGGDLRREGSGNPGAANVQRAAGTGWGLVALGLDAGKGALAVAAAGRWWGAPAAVAAACGSVAAHVFSPWLAGRGGKGVATAAGAFAVVAPLGTAAGVAAFAIATALTRIIALGSVAGGVVLAIVTALSSADPAVSVAAACVAALIAWRHRENFARMRRGTEPRVRWRSPAGGSG